MAAPIIELRDDVKTRIEAELSGVTLQVRRAPYFKREDVLNGVWMIVTAGDEQEIAARQVDRTTLTLDIGYQEAMPEKTDAEPDPLENDVFFGAAMQEVENLKNLFRGGGPLRLIQYWNRFKFRSMTNTPIYRPDLMIEQQIFTSVVRLEFTGEIESA